MTTHYDTLGVRKDADAETIKRAYRELVRQYHPDSLASERMRLQRGGSPSELRELERKHTLYQEKTRQINAAYKVLSDPRQRQSYDAQLQAPASSAARRQREAAAWTPPDPDRVGAYARRRRAENHPKPTQAESAPIALIAFMFLGLLFAFMFVFSLLLPESSVRLAERTPAEGRISSFDLQETAQLANATRAVWTQMAREPSATPLNANTLLNAAEAFFRSGSYDLAAEQYSRALAQLPATAALLLQRGRAYSALAQEANDAAAWDLALADYERALVLDSTLAEVYVERAWLNAHFWQQTGSVPLEALVRADLQTYEVLGGDASAARYQEALARLTK